MDLNASAPKPSDSGIVYVTDDPELADIIQSFYKIPHARVVDVNTAIRKGIIQPLQNSQQISVMLEPEQVEEFSVKFTECLTTPGAEENKEIINELFSAAAESGNAWAQQIKSLKIGLYGEDSFYQDHCRTASLEDIFVSNVRDLQFDQITADVQAEIQSENLTKSKKARRGNDARTRKDKQVKNKESLTLPNPVVLHSEYSRKEIIEASTEIVNCESYEQLNNTVFKLEVKKQLQSLEHYQSKAHQIFRKKGLNVEAQALEQVRLSSSLEKHDVLTDWDNIVSLHPEQTAHALRIMTGLSGLQQTIKAAQDLVSQQLMTPSDEVTYIQRITYYHQLLDYSLLELSENTKDVG